MRHPSTHAQRLERWLGPLGVARLQEAMRGWYGPPIAVHNVPGSVWIYAGGDLVGPITGGGFASLSDLIAEATAGKDRRFCYQKAGPTGVTAVEYRNRVILHV